VQEHLTAWIDGELPTELEGRVRGHLATCGSCAAEAASLRASIGLQQQVLKRLTATDTDVARLHAQLRRTIAAERVVAPRGWLWAWILRPLVLTPALAMIAVMVLLTAAGGPTDVLVPLGVKSPPVAVKRAPDLFKDYTLIQHLDELEHFDTVESESLDDEQDAQTG